MTTNEFIVLIGSVAREDFTEGSDIDICRIGTKKDVPTIPFSIPNGPVCFVDYTPADFEKLYNDGSLFLQHVFLEGRLLEGDTDKWQDLKSAFKVQKNFSMEIAKYVDLYNFTLRDNRYDQKYLAICSNLFIILKNMAIFSLANRQEYIFDKKSAWHRIFGDEYFQLLYMAYEKFERGNFRISWYDDTKDMVAHMNNHFLSKIGRL